MFAYLNGKKLFIDGDNAYDVDAIQSQYDDAVKESEDLQAQSDAAKLALDDANAKYNELLDALNDNATRVSELKGILDKMNAPEEVEVQEESADEAVSAESTESKITDEIFENPPVTPAVIKPVSKLNIKKIL